MLLIPGWGIGMLEISLFMLTSFSIKHFFTSLQNLNNILYYWLCMTVLTGIWESTYISTYNDIVSDAQGLIVNNTHVWTTCYDISYVLPWKLSHIFYAEYGAWADREYMSLTDDWSHVIEGSHAVFCAIFALFGLLSDLKISTNKSMLIIGMSMSFQLMNSLLYMVEYSIQCNSNNSVNYYNNTEFPLGVMMSGRPFMYVNVFWLLLPTYILFYEICNVKQYNINEDEEATKDDIKVINNPPYYEHSET